MTEIQFTDLKEIIIGGIVVILFALGYIASEKP